MSDEIRVETWQIGSIDSPSPSHWRHESQSSDGTVTLTRPRCPVALRAPGVTGRWGVMAGPLAGGTSSSQTVTVSVAGTVGHFESDLGPAGAAPTRESDGRGLLSPSRGSVRAGTQPIRLRVRRSLRLAAS